MNDIQYSLLSSLVVGPSTGGTSEGFRFQKLAEKSEDTEGANDDGVNSFSNPNYENPEVGTKTETVIAPPPTLFGKLVSVEEKETEDTQGSDEKVDQPDEVKKQDEEERVSQLSFLFTDRRFQPPFSAFQGV